MRNQKRREIIEMQEIKILLETNTQYVTKSTPSKYTLVKSNTSTPSIIYILLIPLSMNINQKEINKLYH
ncbi:hypothetical protein MtrunA17_Chr1g0148151 [Medicago truncatula]|uniref:Uncharacterized protein n=1 Tax=Medicago truncatula TaxID=3880 RepID=A0A396JF72_MEDTR|nr:hypothetical protein MtrunA17_Chr1g0148151 [Medicago truncatula]